MEISKDGLKLEQNVSLSTQLSDMVFALTLGDESPFRQRRARAGSTAAMEQWSLNRLEQFGKAQVEVLMDSRWLDLADAYVDRARESFGQDLAYLRERDVMSEERIQFDMHSRASLVQYLEASAGGSGAAPEDLERFRILSEDDIAVFRVIAGDVLRMHFLRALVHDEEYRWCPEPPPPPSPALCDDLVRGAVYTVDPSFNRMWIERIAQVHPKRTATALLGFIQNGTAFEVGGAANASYWFGCFAPRDFVMEPAVECGPIFLRRFVESDNLDLRRCLMRFSWNPDHYEPSLRPFLERAASIAANHPDRYIRSRYQYATGQSQDIPCLPHRSLWKELGEGEPPER